MFTYVEKYIGQLGDYDSFPIADRDGEIVIKPLAPNLARSILQGVGMWSGLIGVLRTACILTGCAATK